MLFDFLSPVSLITVSPIIAEADDFFSSFSEDGRYFSAFARRFSLDSPSLLMIIDFLFDFRLLRF